MNVNENTKQALLDALKNISGENMLIKIYYVNENNYTIKFIDTVTGTKIHTIRKNLDKRTTALDCKWRDK